MEHRKLGKTGIEISKLGYGCTGLFGKDILGKQGMSYAHAVELIKTAIDLGITFFDTGFNYGYAEERLGNCLSELLGNKIKRDQIIIQTKCGETLNKNGAYGRCDFSPDWIKKSIEISLNRLKVDYIDLYAMHGATTELIKADILNVFDDFKRQGLIRAYGICGVNNDLGKWICKQRCFDYVMMTYNVAEARRNGLINDLYNCGIGVLSGASLNRSINSIHFPHNKNDLWYIARTFLKYRGEVKRAKKYSFIKNIEGMSPQQVSLSYVLDNKKITSAVFNTTSISHLKENVMATQLKLPENVKIKIDNIR